MGPEDTLLLCSDGLTRMLSDHRIAKVLRSVSNLDDVAQELIRQANVAGGRDNISVVLVKRQDQETDISEAVTETEPLPSHAVHRFLIERCVAPLTTSLGGKRSVSVAAMALATLAVLLATTMPRWFASLRESMEDDFRNGNGREVPVTRERVRYDVSDDMLRLLEKAAQSGQWNELVAFLNGVSSSEPRVDHMMASVLNDWMHVVQQVEAGNWVRLMRPDAIGLSTADGRITAIEPTVYCARLYEYQESTRKRIHAEFARETRNIKPLLTLIDEDGLSGTVGTVDEEVMKRLRLKLNDVEGALAVFENWLRHPKMIPRQAPEFAVVSDARIDSLRLDVDDAWLLFMRLAKSVDIGSIAPESTIYEDLVRVREAPPAATPYDRQSREWNADGIARVMSNLVDSLPRIGD